MIEARLRASLFVRGAEHDDVTQMQKGKAVASPFDANSTADELVHTDVDLKLLGNGNGTFQPQQPFDAGSPASALENLIHR